MDSTWWWVLAIVLIAIGIVGTVLPVIPGAVVVFAGMLLAAWIDDFQRIGWITLTVLGVLTVLTFVFDIIGALIGAKRVGASRLALVGAAIGTLVGVFFGFLGILIAPFVGAVIGELISRRQMGAAARVGLGTWIGLAVGTLAKIGLVFAMLAVFVTSYLIDSKVQAAASTVEQTLEHHAHLISRAGSVASGSAPPAASRPSRLPSARASGHRSAPRGHGLSSRLSHRRCALRILSCRSRADRESAA